MDDIYEVTHLDGKKEILRVAEPNKANRLEQLVRRVVDELEYVESVLTEAESELTFVRREVKSYLESALDRRENNGGAE